MCVSKEHKIFCVTRHALTLLCLASLLPNHALLAGWYVPFTNDFDMAAESYSSHVPDIAKSNLSLPQRVLVLCEKPTILKVARRSNPVLHYYYQILY